MAVMAKDKKSTSQLPTQVKKLFTNLKGYVFLLKVMAPAMQLMVECDI
jgi:hypothetical protein